MVLERGSEVAHREGEAIDRQRAQSINQVKPIPLFHLNWRAGLFK